MPATEGTTAGTVQDPQSGMWVGAAARVRLSRSLVLCCQGPGIKIYRGELEAEGNTIAFASRGANVVANGGKVRTLTLTITLPLHRHRSPLTAHLSPFTLTLTQPQPQPLPLPLTFTPTLR